MPTPSTRLASRTTWPLGEAVAAANAEAQTFRLDELVPVGSDVRQGQRLVTRHDVILADAAIAEALVGEVPAGPVAGVPVCFGAAIAEPVMGVPITNRNANHRAYYRAYYNAYYNANHPANDPANDPVTWPDLSIRLNAMGISNQETDPSGQRSFRSMLRGNVRSHDHRRSRITDDWRRHCPWAARGQAAATTAH